MSTQQYKDALSPYTRDTGYGPTQTKTVQQRFEQELRGVLGRINATIREGIVSDDIFGLQEEQDTLAVDDPPHLEQESNAKQTALFLAWLKRQLDQEFLRVVGPEENPFIETAYAEGARLATSQLQELDIDVDTTDISEIVDQGNYQRGLRVLFNRTYDELEGLTGPIIREVREELLEGFREGENPTQIAQRITDRVNKIGKDRATLIARTEVINAHADAAIERYREVSDQQDVTIGIQHVGRLTAQDTDVCAFCRRIEDSVFTLDEFQSAAAEFRGTVYRVGIPSHPNGRCTPMPKPGINQDELPPLSERVPGTLVSQ